MTFEQAKKSLDPQNVVQIGKILKPHGYKGQLVISLKFDPALLEEESVLVGIDGWLIPFFIDYKQCNFTAIKPFIKFYEINNLDQAHSLAHKPIFLPRWMAEKYMDINTLDNLIGFTLYDLTSGKTGKITEFQNVKKNPLILIKGDGFEALIPVKAAQVLEFNQTKRYVKVRLPEGLV